jgi:3-phosphoshikimate 1-carboxyvinyltransferase
MTVESDWSSASYFFSLVALSETASILWYKRNSLQGDSALVEIYKQMGVDSRFENNSLTLTKDINFKPETLNLELNNTRYRTNYSCHLSWFRNWLPPYRTSYFKIKETDRLEALRMSLQNWAQIFL